MMRNLSKWAFLILSVSLTIAATAQVASAKCIAGSVHVWPKTDATITSTPLILVEGLLNEQAMVADLASQNPRLESAAGAVPLKVVKIYKSRESKTAALLKPTQQLQPGQTYAL